MHSYSPRCCCCCFFFSLSLSLCPCAFVYRHHRRHPQLRITQSGLFSPRTVHCIGVLCFALALLLCLPAFVVRGMRLVLLVVTCCIAGYAYTGGPYPLAYHGWGDITVIAFFGVAATAGLRFIHVGGDMFSWRTGVAGMQVRTIEETRGREVERLGVLFFRLYRRPIFR